MSQQDKAPVVPAPSAQEFYFPVGGGTDPDFNIPSDREHAPGRLSRWFHALPGFGGSRS